MLNGGGELHQGAEVVELITLPGQLDEELKDFDPINEVALVRCAPHEE